MSGRVGVAFGAVMVALGVLVVARTLQAGGGALSFGLLLGVLFVLGGLGRIWLARQGSRG